MCVRFWSWTLVCMLMGLIQEREKSWSFRREGLRCPGGGTGLRWGSSVAWVHLWASGVGQVLHSNRRKVRKWGQMSEGGWLVCFVAEKWEQIFIVLCAGYYCSVKGFFLIQILWITILCLLLQLRELWLFCVLTVEILERGGCPYRSQCILSSIPLSIPSCST